MADKMAMNAARLLLCLLLAFTGCSTPSKKEDGRASWYGKNHHGRKTASGEPFDMNALTAAHRKLPFGTYLRVTNLRNGKSVVVRINDRGPFAKGRIIDISYAAAEKLDMLQTGEDPVRLEVISN